MGREKRYCRDEAISIELFKPLFESLVNNWDYNNNKEKLSEYLLLKYPQNSYNSPYEY
ncbi:MAG: hypothetical protein Q8P53_02375 [Candidatus Shapirobacteria bacterium]|nr:hypothetical protein [Candidatus Shapirobacteria bacterium]